MNILWVIGFLLNWNQPKHILSDKQFNKKIISISPAGYYGFYTWGVCAYIKDHYSTDDIYFSGASAGSWISVFMTMNKNPNDMIKLIVKNDLYQNKNAGQIINNIKTNIIDHFTTDDFDLDRLFIGVTTLQQTNIYNDFDTIEDALNCCLASSHIPLITGPLLRRYKNKISFDGGFSKHPYLKTNTLHIHPNIWGQHKKMGVHIFKKNVFDIENMYEQGYQDTRLYGKELLDHHLNLKLISSQNICNMDSSQPKVEPEPKQESIETPEEYFKKYGFTLREYEEACFGKDYVEAKDVPNSELK
jgi:hypothetical protein